MDKPEQPRIKEGLCKEELRTPEAFQWHQLKVSENLHDSNTITSTAYNSIQWRNIQHQVSQLEKVKKQICWYVIYYQSGSHLIIANKFIWQELRDDSALLQLNTRTPVKNLILTEALHS